MEPRKSHRRCDERRLLQAQQEMLILAKTSQQEVAFANVYYSFVCILRFKWCWGEGFSERFWASKRNNFYFIQRLILQLLLLCLRLPVASQWDVFINNTHECWAADVVRNACLGRLLPTELLHHASATASTFIRLNYLHIISPDATNYVVYSPGWTYWPYG